MLLDLLLLYPGLKIVYYGPHLSHRLCDLRVCKLILYMRLQAWLYTFITQQPQSLRFMHQAHLNAVPAWHCCAPLG